MRPPKRKRAANSFFFLFFLFFFNKNKMKRNYEASSEENNKRTKIEQVVKEEGEVLLTIDDEGIQPTAQELVDLAMDEFIKGDDAMAHGLFRMALDQFQKENKPVGETVEVGKTRRDIEKLKQGVALFRAELKTQPELKLRVACADMILANQLRMQHIHRFAQQEADLLQTDEESDDGVAVDEVAYEALLLRQQVPVEEIELYEEALGYAFELSSSEVDVHEWKCLIQELKTYGLALDLPLQKDHANTVLNAVIELIQQVPGYSDNWELISFWTACLTHQEKLLNKTQERIKVVSKAIELAYKANELHVAKLSKEHPFIWELVMKSSFFILFCIHSF
jgi:tetratricopeptide (TPR) repeat protein